MRLDNAVAVALLSIMPTLGAQSQESPVMAKMMLAQCADASKGKIETELAAYCFGTVSTLGFVSTLLNDKTKFCKPPAVTVGGLMEVVVDYMQKNPEKLSYPLPAVAMLALKTAFPCKG